MQKASNIQYQMRLIVIADTYTSLPQGKIHGFHHRKPAFEQSVFVSAVFAGATFMFSMCASCPAYKQAEHMWRKAGLAYNQSYTLK